jgi:hypothetical protein
MNSGRGKDVPMKAAKVGRYDFAAAGIFGGGGVVGMCLMEID